MIIITIMIILIIVIVIVIVIIIIIIMIYTRRGLALAVVREALLNLTARVPLPPRLL